MSAEKLAAESARWMAQALDDFRAAGILLAGGGLPQAGFYAQQTAEKAIKAVLYSLDADPWGHSIRRLIDGMTEPARATFSAVRDAAIALDKLYIPTRYPDALPDSIPAEAYTRAEIEQAMAEAKRVLEACEAWLKAN